MVLSCSAIKISSQARGGDGWLMASALPAWKFKNATDPSPRRMWVWIFTPGTKGMWVNLQSLWCASKELCKSLEHGFQTSNFLGVKPRASVPAVELCIPSFSTNIHSCGRKQVFVEAGITHNLHEIYSSICCSQQRTANVSPVGSHGLGYDCIQKALKIHGLGFEWDF